MTGVQTCALPICWVVIPENKRYEFNRSESIHTMPQVTGLNALKLRDPKQDVVEVVDPEEAYDPTGRVGYTAAMVDEAAAEVTKDMSDDDAQRLYEMWSRDAGGQVADVFLRSQIEARAKSGFSQIGKLKATVRIVLDEDGTRNIVRLYPEFDISFESTIMHDHPQAAACRPLDYRLLERNRPPGMKFMDIGGSIIKHVEAGNEDVLVVAPLFDDKDAFRKLKARLRLKKLAAGEVPDARVKGGEATVRMAKSILAGEGKYLREVKAQALRNLRIPFAVACHVYDVPLRDWPAIMENCETLVLEGCLHFSNALMDSTTGVMGTVGQRFVIDHAKDEIAMGFEGSSAPWYRHRWSDYMLYGVDQVLQGERYRYSYKIVARKGDTLYYRIIRVGPTAKADRRQVYDTPGIDMVQVRGYDVPRMAREGRPCFKDEWYPAQLFERMVRDAVNDVIRASRPDIQKLIGTYRVAVAAHSYNSLVKHQTQRIEGMAVMEMAVNAAMAGYAEVMLMNAQARANMAAQLGERLRWSESTAYKAFAAFLETALQLLKLPLFPFKYVANAIDEAAKVRLNEFLVMWQPVKRVKSFKLSMFLDMEPNGKRYLSNHQLPFKHHMLQRRNADMLVDMCNDPEYARVLLKQPDALAPNLRAHCERVVAKHTAAVDPGKARLDQATAEQPRGQASGTGSPGVAASAAPSYHTDDPASADALLNRVVKATIKAAGPKAKVIRYPRPANEHEERISAIQEAIEDVEKVGKKIYSEMESLFMQLCPGGNPSAGRFRQGAEKRRNPDAWFVTNGVIAETSLLGASKFTHAGVWLCQPPRAPLTRLVSVDEEWYDGPDTVTGAAVRRRYFVVGDPTYTGWALVTDDTVIMNGPDILEALRASLNVPHDYDIVVGQGAAGAGKTTSICASFQPGDMLLCPVRASTDDSRDRLKEVVPDWKMRLRMVRTTDSFLKNWKKAQVQGRELQAEVVYADEVFMARAGHFYAAMGLLRAKILVGYGDRKQIPVVPRVDVAKAYLAVTANIEVQSMMAYRCKPSIMAIWAPFYNYTIRTPLADDGADVRMVRSWEDVQFPATGSVAVIGMYQANKLEIEKALAQRIKAPGLRKRLSIMTTHEAQGKTFDHVFLYNPELRNRSVDAMYLWDKESYVLVSSSRPRTTLVMVKIGKFPDLLERCFRDAQDPRRVKAVMQLETAGESVDRKSVV